MVQLIDAVSLIWLRQITYNGSAMVSTGFKSSELLIKHLAKTFYFVLSFCSKAKSKDLVDLV
jgi:hypothetical protein